MTPPFVPPSRELVAEVRALAERVLTRDELEAYLGAPMSDDERDEILDAIRWFTTRYPTPAARLAYNRRAMKRAKRRASIG
jgi:hypothetical protein